ncbi:MAG TPA: hypothetical protein H9790_03975 [Candidatus Agathobaculum intestinipullorum]|nr:hypothetical protein [Candidatus Agathobaculum intestinipullorum]
MKRFNSSPCGGAAQVELDAKMGQIFSVGGTVLLLEDLAKARAAVEAILEVVCSNISRYAASPQGDEWKGEG